MPRRIHVIINPASGQPKPILHTINNVFREAGVDWDITITKESGDAEKAAHAAAEHGADVVAVYGGDGSVMETARGLLFSKTPMAILPGGTANLMSVELGIPKDLAQAASLITNPSTQQLSVDMGQISDTYFLLRVGIGFAARKVEIADRDLKDRYGVLAYSIGALKALQDSKPTKYWITLDDEPVIEAEGLSCLVDNAGNIGIPQTAGLHNINVGDGFLDVILIKNTSFRSIVAVSGALIGSEIKEGYISHWQARQIKIETDTPQPVQVDGEIVKPTPVNIKVIPHAVQVLVGVR